MNFCYLWLDATMSGPEDYIEIERSFFAKNGRLLYLRSIRSADELLIKDLFGSLSPRTISSRFLGHWKCVPREVITYLLKIDYSLNVGMVALEKRPTGECILGLCSILRKPGSTRGEFAVVIRDEWQGMGIGAELLKASLPAAKALGMKELWGLSSPENTTMLAVAGKLGFIVRKRPDSDLYEMEIHL